MQVVRKDFLTIIPDNEDIFFAQLEGLLESVDELALVQITRLSKYYNVRISPSIPKYNNLLISEIIDFHNMFGIRVEFSKSIKSTGVIIFNIYLDDK